ncbi:MAG: hypothetical protein FWD53_13075 [Phycisphaerales bacterium]|nr:hypothetical protein [Phycisphaerales bacterium]
MRECWIMVLLGLMVAVVYGEVAATPEKVAESEWTRTAAQVNRATDLAAIIELHKKFLEKFPDQSISANVRTSLEEYERLERGWGGAVKFRGRWMLAVQKDVMLRAWDDDAKPAMDLYRTGKMRECLETATKLAATDDQNPTAFALAGLAAYRLNQLPMARLHFTKLGQLEPTSVLAANNLAVIAAQQNNPIESLRHYLKALQAAPDNRMVLDNIIEATVNFAGDQNSPAFTELTRQFSVAEESMQEQMAAKGLYRWGSTWVAKDVYDHLAAHRQAVQDAMAQLDQAYRNRQQWLVTAGEQIKRSVTDYNKKLADVNTLNQTIASTRFGQDTAPLILQRDAMLKDLESLRAQKTTLELQRNQLTVELASFPMQADQLKKALAVSDASLYPGIHRIMQVGEDKFPPLPLPIAVSPLPSFTLPAILEADAKVVPLNADQILRQQMAEVYRQLATPLGLPMPRTE